MVSEMSASASNQFLETSNTSHAMNSSLRSRITSATRNRSDARSSTETRLQCANALRAAFTAGSTCSLPAFWWTPTTSEGLAGLMERILSEVLKRLPPTIRSYSRPSWPRTLPMAERILRTLSSLLKSTNVSFLNAPWCRRTCRRGGASMVAIGDPFWEIAGLRKSILHRLDPRLSGIGSQVSGRSKLESSFVKPSGRHVYWLVPLPPSPPRYWNHGVREEKPTRSLILKDLQPKSLRTNDLRCQRALKMGLGQLQGPSSETGTALATPIRWLLSHWAGWRYVMALTGWL